MVTSLVVQWLGLDPCSHAHGLGPIPGQGTGSRQLRLSAVKINNKNK